MKKAIFLFGFILFGFSIYAQKVNELKITCDSIVATHLVVDTLSKKMYQIPNGWNGEFEGELPSLRLIHNNSGSYIMANEAIDSGFDFLERIKKEYPNYIELEINGYKITAIYNSEKQQFESYYYVKEFFETEPWFWRIILNRNPKAKTEIEICGYLKVISEFTKNNQPK